MARDRNIQIKLLNSFVRPILEYPSPVWSPHLKHDVTVIERVQKHSMKSLRDLHNRSYTGRLAILYQPSLQLRSWRTDLIYLHKILHGLVDTTLKSIFTLSTDVFVSDRSLRGHALKLHKLKPRTDMLRHNCFFRVVEEWNTLPKYVAEAVSLSVFKQKLSTHLHCC